MRSVEIHDWSGSRLPNSGSVLAISCEASAISQLSENFRVLADFATASGESRCQSITPRGGAYALDAIQILSKNESRHCAAIDSYEVSEAVAEFLRIAPKPHFVLFVATQSQARLPFLGGISIAIAKESAENGNPPQLNVWIHSTDAPYKSEASLLSCRAEAARLVRETGSVLNPDVLRAKSKSLLASLPNVTVMSIVGEELRESQLDGIFSVGMAASCPPSLVIAEFDPGETARQTIVMVGKGVTFDSGGLNLKSRSEMANMKCDMAGAVAALFAFLYSVQMGSTNRLVCLLPIAENAIGPQSYKPGDLVTLHSGIEVEVTNTDSEGRIMIADCVGYARARWRPQLIVDIGTLTSAQLLATGDRHAAFVANSDELEKLMIEVGLRTGDQVFPMPFLPISSNLRGSYPNSITNSPSRQHAKVSAAAAFIYRSISSNPCDWIHIDMLGPAFIDGVGTGFGVFLLADLLRTYRKT